MLSFSPCCSLSIILFCFFKNKKQAIKKDKSNNKIRKKYSLFFLYYLLYQSLSFCIK